MMMLIAAAALMGCGTVRTSAMAPVHGASCASLGYSKQDLKFRCGSVTYDLLATPVRSQRIFDIVTRESFTRRHYLVQVGGQRYAFKAEQMEGERYPRQVVLETGQGFTRLLLDLQGNVVGAMPAVSL